MHETVTYDNLWFFLIVAVIWGGGLILLSPKLMNYLDKLADKKYQARDSALLENRAGKAEKDE